MRRIESHHNTSVARVSFTSLYFFPSTIGDGVQAAGLSQRGDLEIQAGGDRHREAVIAVAQGVDLDEDPVIEVVAQPEPHVRFVEINLVVDVVAEPPDRNSPSLVRGLVGERRRGESRDDYRQCHE